MSRGAKARSAQPHAGLWACLACAVLAFGAVEWYRGLSSGADIGADYRMYVEATMRFLRGEAFYLAHQLAGPYQISHLDVLYPPTAILLFAPFLALPGFVWWILPLGLVAWGLVRLRPAPMTWPVIALCIVFPTTMVKIAAGNPAMWAMAALVIGASRPSFAPLALLKPSLAPLALLGSWRSSWWIGLAAIVGTSAIFLPLWLDYAQVILNARSPSGPLHSLGEVPMLLVGWVAWLGSAVGRHQERHLVARPAAHAGSVRSAPTMGRPVGLHGPPASGLGAPN